jgi:orotidine-5'-phosphate decarboxylase
VADARSALALVDRLGDDPSFFKVGLELFTAAGPPVVGALRDLGKDVFLDLKYLDIPNTVAGAVRSAADLGVRFLTLHATGGPEMLAAAVEAAEDRVELLGVTILTSMDRDVLEGVWNRPVHSVADEVVRLASMCVEQGLAGVVCSPKEARVVSDALGRGLEVVTPGVRFAGGDRDDQRRVATPAGAVAAGATRLVMGRPITRAEDPRAAFRRAAEEVRTAALALA